MRTPAELKKKSSACPEHALARARSIPDTNLLIRITTPTYRLTGGAAHSGHFGFVMPKNYLTGIFTSDPFIQATFNESDAEPAAVSSGSRKFTW